MLRSRMSDKVRTRLNPFNGFAVSAIAIMVLTIVYIVTFTERSISTVQALPPEKNMLDKVIELVKRKPTLNDSRARENRGTKKVLIITAGRSASSTVAQLIARSEDSTIYWFEPGHCVSLSGQKADPGTILQITRDIFNCGTDKLFSQVTPFVGRLPTGKAIVAYFQCKFNAPKHVCLKQFQEACHKSKLIVVKYIRVRMETAVSLLRSEPHLRIIYLIRNPVQRFISHFKTFIDNPPVLYTCQDQLDDLAVIANLPTSYQSRIKIVRSEDVTGNMGSPDKSRKDIYEFLDLKDTESMKIWHGKALNCSNEHSRGKPGFYTQQCRRAQPLTVENIPDSHWKHFKTLVNGTSCHSLSSIFGYKNFL